MHVAGCMVFEGTAPAYDELVEQIVSRLHLVPRYRQRLAFVPLQPGRPVWVDDPHFNVAFHVRHTALPSPGGEEQLKRLAGRVFSQALDRSRPLWEIWLVEGLADDRFALLSKTHHALVDGVSGVDIATVLFDASPDPMPVAPPDHEWVPRPLPTGAQLLADALLERATVPGRDRARRAGRRCAALARSPAGSGRRWAARRDGRAGLQRGARRARSTCASARTAGSPGCAAIWLSSRRSRTRSAARSTMSCSPRSPGRWGATCGCTASPPRISVLRAMVPVSVRADVERGALGNRVAAMWAPLPVGLDRPGAAPADDQPRDGRDQGVRPGRRRAGADRADGFAPPTIMAQAARLQARQRLFNLVVTNVPGPAVPALHARPPARGDVSRWCRWPRTRRWGSRS